MTGLLNIEAGEIIAPLTTASLIEMARQDIGKAFEDESIEFLQALRKTIPADYQRLRAELKKIKGLSITELEQQVRPKGESREFESVTEQAIELACERCTFVHDENKQGYAVFDRDGHNETWLLDSSGFREWLSSEVYRAFSKGFRKSAQDDAVATLNGHAVFDGEQVDVAMRVATHKGVTYIDLCDEEWQVIRVDSVGWTICKDSPVHFIRQNTMRSLPFPKKNGDIEKLWDFANIPECSRTLLLACVLECFRSNTPFMIVELVGEQGTAKSSTQSTLRELIDPNEVNLRGAPKTTEDVYVAARNNHLVSYENLSHLSAPLQDAFCTLATGGGFATRQLYSNGEESVVKAHKPVFLNSIANVVTAPDLQSRALTIIMQPVKRRTEQNLKEEFELAKPEIFGALLDIFSAALSVLPSIEIPHDELPRMADFALLGCAVSVAQGQTTEAFLSSYRKNRDEATYLTIEASPVAVAVMALLERRPAGFHGTTKHLYEELENYRPRCDSTAWPKSPKGLADVLRRLAPSLGSLGISAEMGLTKTRSGVTCRIVQRRQFADQEF